MANLEHLDILKQGVKIWNWWREEYVDTQPDLSNATLDGQNLGRANLWYANFSGADLSQADLSSAILVGTDMSKADLSEAYLVGANLNGANLSEANLSRAKIGWTVFGSTDLRLARGLETVEHFGPSTIGMDTIYRSEGYVPEVFLRKVGLPDALLKAMQFLANASTEYYTVFISFSSKNQDFAKRLYADLQSHGVRCWYAPKDLKIGAKIRPRIDESIRHHDKLLLVFSEHSIASQWVEQEVETALAKERKENRIVLFPIRLDRAVMEIDGGWPALIRNTRNIGDFTRWKRHDAYQKALDRLLQDLKSEASKPGS